MASQRTPKAAGSTISDVARPGNSAASATSRQVIVPNRPILKDPMMLDNSGQGATEETTLPTKISMEPLAKQAAPLTPTAVQETSPDTPEDAKPDATPIATLGKTDDVPEPVVDEIIDPVVDNPLNPDVDVDNAIAAEVAREADVAKLVESGKYYLPINTVEKRRAKRFVALGIVLILLLVAAWGVVALDAGLIVVDGVKSPTHFFSN